MSSKWDLLNSLTVKQLRELAQENRIPLIREGLLSSGPAKSKYDIVEILDASRKISDKKIKDKMFGPKTTKKTARKTPKKLQRRYEGP